MSENNFEQRLQQLEKAVGLKAQVLAQFDSRFKDIEFSLYRGMKDHHEHSGLFISLLEILVAGEHLGPETQAKMRTLFEFRRITHDQRAAALTDVESKLRMPPPPPPPGDEPPGS